LLERYLRSNAPTSSSTWSKGVVYIEGIEIYTEGEGFRGARRVGLAWGVGSGWGYRVCIIRTIYAISLIRYRT
jgi:hypothetical protein